MKIDTMRVKTMFVLVCLMIFNGLTAQDYAKKQIENSPRHHEWVDVPAGERKVNCFVAYPEVAKKATVVIVIHENKGLTEWVMSFADQLAAEGYIAIAPDLLSGFSPEFPKTSSFATAQDATNALYKLDQKQVTADLNHVADYGQKIPAGNGHIAVAGFCWGGSQSFRMAQNNANLKAAMVFYGGSNLKDGVESIKAPMYGFYGENDQRVNAGIPATDSAMKAAGKIFIHTIYPGAGHAYMRSGDDPAGTGPNKEARDASWIEIKKILGNISDKKQKMKK